MNQPLPTAAFDASSLLAATSKLALLGAIRAYQYTLSAAFGPCCRFHPSCSHYGYEAVARFGALRGGWLAAKRIARCHPWNPGGEDPVPQTWPIKAGTHRISNTPASAACETGPRRVTVERIAS